MEDGRGCNARISGGRVRARPEAGSRMRSRAETMLTRRLSTVDRRTFLRGLGPRIRGTDTRHTSPTSTSSPARTSSWHGSYYMARAPVLDPPRMHPPLEHQGTIASRTSDDAVYRSGPSLQPHPDPAQQCQGVSVLPALAAVIPSAIPAAAVSAALTLLSVVLLVVPAAELSVTFTASAAFPAPVQPSHTVLLATVLSECVTALTPPVAARRSVLPLGARAIGPPDCAPTGTAATQELPSAPMRHIIPSPSSPSARGDRD
ncbi:hypothetical protein PIB30_070347 [Stylosanthes scabra]|uniref:Uncharacterized protein n=1 Tax=Stylosanthes scabra TaxID=79078 RepID=A0ABU6XLB0_9FABA|nr:hypothetical protein [Stylosanthes scabra]